MVSQRLRSLCWVIGWCAGLGAMLVAVGIAVRLLHSAGLLTYPHGGFEMRFDGPEPAAGTPLAFAVPALLLEATPDVFLIWVFVALARLMRFYSRGEVFTQAALGEINAMALGLLGNALAILIFNPAASFVLSLARPHHEISIGFGSSDGIRLFEAAVVYVAALVMAEARRLADENARFV
jgi:hypothetical protein